MKTQIILATSFAIIAVLIWLAFLRPAARIAATGTITSKTFKPAGAYSQSNSGPRRSFQGPKEIPIAEAYLFEIKIEGLAEPMRMALNPLASRKFEVGQRVLIEYQRRGIPPFWTRFTVIEMNPSK